jgi:hypothetical protein
MTPFIVYSLQHDFHLPGVELLHPFDGRKYSHAWTSLENRFGRARHSEACRFWDFEAAGSA